MYEDLTDVGEGDCTTPEALSDLAEQVLANLRDNDVGDHEVRGIEADFKSVIETMRSMQEEIEHLKKELAH